MSDPHDLEELPLFAGTSNVELQEAARLLTPVHATPGRVLMHQGDEARQFVIVEEGEVEVTVTNADGTVHRVVLGPNSFVGEVGLIDHVPCTATVKALTGAWVHVANAAEFRQLMEILPVANHVRGTADDRLAVNELALH